MTDAGRVQSSPFFTYNQEIEFPLDEMDPPFDMLDVYNGPDFQIEVQVDLDVNIFGYKNPDGDDFDFVIAGDDHCFLPGSTGSRLRIEVTGNRFGERLASAVIQRDGLDTITVTETGGFLDITTTYR